MSHGYKHNDVDGMTSAIVKSVKDDDPKALSELLLKNNVFWDGRLYDDFLMEYAHEHLIGLCLEHDSQNCAKYLLKANLPKHDLNAKGSEASGIEPALSHALANHANEIVSLLLEYPELRSNDKFDGVTPLERALINYNFEGAEILIKARNLLDPEKPRGAIYHQLKAAELSMWDNQERIDFIVTHTPDNIVFPSVGFHVISSSHDGSDKLMRHLFSIGLSADEMLNSVCAVARMSDYSENMRRIEMCLEYGANFSYEDYNGVVLLARQGDSESFAALVDCGFNVNEKNGAPLKAAIRSFDSTAFSCLIDIGADVNLLGNRVGTFVKEPHKLTGKNLEQLSLMQIKADKLTHTVAQKNSAQSISP